MILKALYDYYHRSRHSSFLLRKVLAGQVPLLQTICMTIVNMYLVIPIRGIWKRYVSTLKYLRRK